MSEDTRKRTGHEPTLPLIIGALISLTVISLVIGAYFEPTFRIQLMSMKELIASIGVIGAALITYDGATSKTRLDRAIHEEQRERKRLNLFLKAEQAVATVVDQVQSTVGFWWFGKPEFMSDQYKVPSRHLSLERPKVMDDIWNDLATFPQPVISSFRKMEKELAQLDDRIKRIVKADTNYSVPRNASYIHVHADDFIGLRDAFGSLHKLGQVLLKQISDEIPIKGLSREEYDLLLYGEQSDDEFV